MNEHAAGMARTMHSEYFHAEVTAMAADRFILVADDDEPSREGLKLLLGRWGYAAETAVDGADALHLDVPTIVVTGTHEGARTGPKLDS